MIKILFANALLAINRACSCAGVVDIFLKIKVKDVDSAKGPSRKSVRGA